MSPRAAELAAQDRELLWHPYSPCPNPVDAVAVDKASGVYLHLSDGRVVIDAMSSWWAAALGHSHPELVAAAQQQIDRMSHVMFGGLTHEPAVRLGEQLTRLTGMDKVFYADSGSVSVEVAVKMAIQYQRGIGHPERTIMLTWRGGYHGDTFAPMSVCDPEGGMHALWRGIIAQQKFVPAPPTRGASAHTLSAYLAQIEAAIDDSIAAIIVEPVVQGAGGMRFHDAELVAGLRDICDRTGRLLVVDEIATGFGRTGSLFAVESAGIRPDIMCVGKALTGGFMTFAAALTTNAVAHAISTPAGGGALMHGPTFMGNPLACAVSSAALRVYERGDWRAQVARIEHELIDGLAVLHTPSGQPLDGIADIRVLGAIGVVELHTPVDMAATTEAALAEGVWIRPFGTLIYVMPPYVCTSAEIAQICHGVVAAVHRHLEGN
ncbi:adenosylmethionine--8-amino-7-oxononanoate transaminase [Staphylococcus chromogenes]|nr:adenosylmethionine--8-amino-7-oxononanoate transaminase [Staphylococcus chromogenes]